MELRKQRSVGDIIGIVIMLAVMVGATALLGLSVMNFYGEQVAMHNAQVLRQLNSEENLSIVQTYIPINGHPEYGIVVTNYGPTVNITNLIQEQNGQLTFTSENIVLEHLQSATFPVPPGTVGLLTSYGGSFFANYTSDEAPVSLMTIDLQLQYYSPQTGWIPFQPGLYYFPYGTYLTLITPRHATWFVNGTELNRHGFFNQHTIYINGPTTLTLVQDYHVSVNTNSTYAGSVSPSSGWYMAGTTITFNETANPGYTFTGWSGTYNEPSSVTSFNVTVSGTITEVANYTQV